MQNNYKKFYFVLGAAILVMAILIGLRHVPGKVRINTNLSDAQILFDGKEIKEMNFWTKPGDYRISATKKDYFDVQISVKVLSIFGKKVDLKLLKYTDVSNDQTSSFNAATISGENSNFLSIDDKAVYKFENGKSKKLLDLPFLANEKYSNDKWSDDRGLLYIRTLNSDKFNNRLVNLTDLSIKDLGADVLDVAFKDKDFYTLEKAGDKAKVVKQSQTLLNLDFFKNNFDAYSDGFYFYNKVGYDLANEAKFCNLAKKCETKMLPGKVLKLKTTNGAAYAVLVGKNYMMYDLLKSDTVSSNVAPLLNLDGQNLHYIEKGKSCDLIKYDGKTKTSIYANDALCSINSFNVFGEQIYIADGLNLIKLENK